MSYQDEGESQPLKVDTRMREMFKRHEIGIQLYGMSNNLMQ